MTLAEVHDLPGRECIEGGEPTLDGASIMWHAEQRPIQVSIGPPLDGEIAETLENLPEDEGSGPDRVRAYVAATPRLSARSSSAGGEAAS
jgi:hypothetical protein